MYAKGPKSQLLEKLRQRVFGSKQNTPASIIQAFSSADSEAIDQSLHLDAFIAELQPSISLARRISLVNELCPILKTYSFSDVHLLWNAVEPMLEEAQSQESNQAALKLMIAILQGQYDTLGTLRPIFFVALKKKLLIQDFPLRFLALRTLTKEGRDVSYLDSTFPLVVYDCISYCFRQFTQIPSSSTTTLKTPIKDSKSPELQNLEDAILYFTNLIKFNFVNFEEKDLISLVRLVSSIQDQCQTENVRKLCLDLFDVIIRYGYIPFEVLQDYTHTLCITAIIPQLQDQCWHIFRNLLNSHSAYKAMYILCKILEETQSAESISLLQGAVYFVGMANWSSQKVESLFYSFSFVLPCLHRAIQSGHLEVELEILLNLHRIVISFSKDLSQIEWELLFDILEEVNYRVLENGKRTNHGLEQAVVLDDEPMLSKLIKYHNNILFKTKECYLADDFFASASRFVKLLETLNKCIAFPYIELIINYYEKSHECYPTQPDWVNNIERLIANYFIAYENVAVQEKLFNMVKGIYSTSKEFYQSQLINSALIPIFNCLQKDLDGNLAIAILNCLIEVLFEFPNNEFHILFSLLITFSQTGEEAYSGSTTILETNVGVTDNTSNKAKSSNQELHNKRLYLMNEAIVGLFVASFNIYPSSICLHIFEQLIVVLQSETYPVSLRLSIMDCLLSLRASSHCKIYLECTEDYKIPIFNEYTTEFPRTFSNPYIATMNSMSSAELKRSQFVSVSLNTEESVLARTTSYAVFPVNSYLLIMAKMIASGNSWDCILLGLSRLPAQLYNVTLFTDATAALNELRTVLCTGVLSSSLGGDVRNRASKLKRSTLYELAFYIIGSFLCYSKTFTKQQCDEIILSFQIGLFKYPNTAKICIQYLTLCCYQIPLSMTKLLPSILGKLSQIMSAGTISVQILEFLSTLARLPHLYVNFVEGDYKLVFGVALQYIQHTSTSQSQQKDTLTLHSFSQYVLEMAYHVLIIWYMSLKISNRRLYIPFIIRGLNLAQKNNVTGIKERNEVVYDMLARYSFTTAESKISKPFISTFLLNKQIFRISKKSWIHGISLYTVEANMDLGWAEIAIRRPSGNISFLTKIETNLLSSGSMDSSLREILLAHLRNESDETNQLSDPNASIPVHASIKETSSENSTNLDIYKDNIEAVITRQKDEGPLRPFDLQLSNSFELSSANMSNVRLQRSQSLSQSVFLERAHKKLSQSEKSAPGSMGNTNLELVKTFPMSSPKLMENKMWEKPYSQFEKELIAQILNTMGSNANVTFSGQTSNTFDFQEPCFDPSFFFMQLSSYPDTTGVELTHLLPDDASINRAISVLDRIFVIDFHKIGIVYVGPHQKDEVEILNNQYGSEQYNEFLKGLGEFFSLKASDGVYTGGLDTESNLDGEFACYFKDAISQIIYHIATLMPSTPQTDPRCSAKKRHIGNDFVTIVFNDSPQPYSFNTIPGQFNFANIVIEPLSSNFSSNQKLGFSTQTSIESGSNYSSIHDFFRVSLQRRPDMPDIGPLSSPKVVSAQALPSFVRQIALHINIFVQIFLLQSQHPGFPVEFVSNWRERLRQLKRIRERVRPKLSSSSLEIASSSSGLKSELKRDASTSDVMLDQHILTEPLDFTKFL